MQAKTAERAGETKSGKPAAAARAPRTGPWLVIASEPVAAAAAQAASALGVSAKRIDPGSSAPMGRENVVLVELGATSGEREEAWLRRALRARAMPVALLPEPTLERFARAVRAGALDVLGSAALAPESIASRAPGWGRVSAGSAGSL